MSYKRKSIGAEDIEWQGRTYRRHPSHKDIHRQRYYMATTSPRTYLHRDIWEHHYAQKVPKGWEVHHKDNDFNNNNPLNLEAVPSADHTRSHWKSRKSVVTVCGKCGKPFEASFARARWCSPACKESYRRENGLAYQRPKKEHWEEVRNCQQCGGEYTAKKRWSRFCSAKCRGEAGRMARKNNTQIQISDRRA